MKIKDKGEDWDSSHNSVLDCVFHILKRNIFNLKLSSMAKSSSVSSYGFFTILLLILVVLWSGTVNANECYSSIISFGDSLADTGNLKQLASIEHKVFNGLLPPYGQNFVHQATGRCSNGRLIIDFVAEGLGLPLIPPYVSSSKGDTMELGQGVNYAVAGATALDSSFLETKGVLNHMTNASLRVQMDWFKQSLSSFCLTVSDCRNLVGRSLILMGEIGGNDYNYPLLASPKSINEVKSYVPLVIDTIVSAINELIEIGAQTLVIPGNLPIGCSAAYLTMYSSEKEEYDNTTGCLIWLNKFVEYHNELLQTKLNHIQDLHPNVNIIYADYYNAAMQIYRSPDKFGFTNGALKACCGGGGEFNFKPLVHCADPSSTTCDQPDTYVSWDGIHLTEAAYRVIYKNLFQGSYTTPPFNSLCPTSTLQVPGGLSSSLY